MLDCGQRRILLATGRVYPRGEGLCHSVPILDDHIKVHVDRVVEKYSVFDLPVLTEDMTTLGQAWHSFVQWPKDRIHVLDQATTSARMTLAPQSADVVADQTLAGPSQRPPLPAKSVLVLDQVQRKIKQTPQRQHD